MPDVHSLSIPPAPAILVSAAAGVVGEWSMRRGGQVIRTNRNGPPSIDPRHEALAGLVRVYVLAHLGRFVAISEIVAVSGVSERTLRRAVLATTGRRLSPFMTDVRLDQVRAWLISRRESRTQTQLAAALGFVSGAALGRSYRRRFGEAITETRRRTANGETISSV